MNPPKVYAETNPAAQRIIKSIAIVTSICVSPYLYLCCALGKPIKTCLNDSTAIDALVIYSFFNILLKIANACLDFADILLHITVDFHIIVVQ